MGHHAENPFPFLELPSEVRNKVYSDVLTSCMPLRMVYCSSRGKPASPSCLVLLEVSRQIYEEAFHLFYQENILQFRNTENLVDCLYLIGYARRQEIRSIDFNWTGQEPKVAFRVLRTCQRLKEVTIRNFVDGLERSGLAALREVRGLEVVQTIFRSRWSHEEAPSHSQSWVEPPKTNDGSLAYYMMRPRVYKGTARSTGYDLYKQPVLRRRQTEVQRLIKDQLELSRRGG